MMPEGYSLRNTTEADVEAAQELLNAVESADAGEPRRHDLEVAVICRDTRVALSTNTWVVQAPDGELAAFAYLFWGDSAQGETEPYVHPGHRRLGLGFALLEAVEGRAQSLATTAPPDVTPRLHVWCEQTNVRRRDWLLGKGYRSVRESYRMRIDLLEQPPAPAPLPAGIEVRPFVVGRDEHAIYGVDEEAFAEHFLFESSTFEQWHTHTIELSAFDPSLWLVAWSGDEAAGEALTLADESEALVDSLAVRRAWRGRGLGLALLTRAFGAAHERGFRTIRLGVDAQNTTGALALYRRAGMSVERRYETYARDLR